MKFAAAAIALLLVMLGGAAQAAPMKFQAFEGFEGCSGCVIVSADGEITNSTPEVFRDFTSARDLRFGRQTVVVLSSPGGSLSGGLALGRLFRTGGFNTHIGRVIVDEEGKIAIESADCASACAYAFLGGAERSISHNSRYGLHQLAIYSDQAISIGAAVASTQDTLAKLNEYVRAMGSSPEIVTVATDTRSTSINWVDFSKWSTLRITNSQGLASQRPWKMMNSPSYYSVWTTLPTGVRELILMSCDRHPYGPGSRGTVTMSVSVYKPLPIDHPLAKSYSTASLTLTAGARVISLPATMVDFDRQSIGIRNFKVPFSFLREAASSGVPPSIQFRAAPSFAEHFDNNLHVLPLQGLTDALENMQRECPHLS